MLILDKATTRAFADATRLTPGEVTALTLVGLADRYPPLSFSYLGRDRQLNGVDPAVACGSPSPAVFGVFDRGTSSWKTSPRCAPAASGKSWPAWRRSV
jgi:hypothetical protein